MTGHDLWHVAVLGSTLFAAAGVAILVLAPLIFDETPRGVIRARPAIGAVVVLATVLLGLEWLGIH